MPNNKLQKASFDNSSTKNVHKYKFCLALGTVYDCYRLLAS